MKDLINYILEGIKVNSKSKFAPKDPKTFNDWISKYTNGGNELHE